MQEIGGGGEHLGQIQEVGPGQESQVVEQMQEQVEVGPRVESMPRVEPSSQTLRFGKNKGKTFQDVMQTQLPYCQWYLKSRAEKQDTKPCEFAEYLVSQGVQKQGTKMKTSTFVSTNGSYQGAPSMTTSRNMDNDDILVVLDNISKEVERCRLLITKSKSGSAQQPYTLGISSNTYRGNGEQTLSFGKHKGRTYEDVATNEHGWCQWLLKQPRDRPNSFVTYLQSRQAA